MCVAATQWNRGMDAARLPRCTRLRGMQLLRAALLGLLPGLGLRRNASKGTPGPQDLARPPRGARRTGYRYPQLTDSRNPKPQ